eukprot:9989220-Heterocapsa_arctica.AAC.1
MYGAAVRQLSQKKLIHRVVASLTLWSRPQWEVWRNDLMDNDKLQKASLPLSKARAVQANTVREWSAAVAKKRPAAIAPINKRPATGLRKRTPFTRATGVR